MPAKTCTFATVAYFVSCELETLVQAVVEEVWFHKQAENTWQLLTAMLVRNRFPLEAQLVDLCLQHPTFHGFLGAHFTVLVVWFPGVPNRNSSH